MKVCLKKFFLATVLLVSNNLVAKDCPFGWQNERNSCIYQDKDFSLKVNLDNAGLGDLYNMEGHSHFFNRLSGKSALKELEHRTIISFFSHEDEWNSFAGFEVLKYLFLKGNSLRENSWLAFSLTSKNVETITLSHSLFSFSNIEALIRNRPQLRHLWLVNVPGDNLDDVNKLIEKYPHIHFVI